MIISESNIQYPCIHCILNNFPWVKNQLFEQEALNNRPTDQATGKKESTVTDPEARDLPLPNSKSDQTDHILIIDTKPSPSTFKTSKEIEKKLKEKGVQEVDRAYSLSQGGIAIHFKDPESRNTAQKYWPKGVFGEKESIHEPKHNSHRSSTTGFCKNIDPNLKEENIRTVLNNLGCKVLKVQRLFNRNTGRYMPVVKLLHENHSALETTLQTKLPFKFHGKEAYVEEQRKTKVVRCYNCMRFGHIAAACNLPTRCENCGQTGHQHKECKNQANCTNCSGKHPASSSQCESFKAQLKSLLLKKIL